MQYYHHHSQGIKVGCNKNIVVAIQTKMTGKNPVKSNEVVFPVKKKILAGEPNAYKKLDLLN
jgi:hypothetical protein